MRRSSRTLTGTLVILGVIAGACSPAATPAPSGAAPAPGATAPPSAAAPGTAAASPSAAAAAGGGELSMAVEGDLQTLDPAICYDTNCGPVMHMLFDSLVAYGPNSAELQAGLADLPDVSADGLTYTFHLRDGVSFTKQDGTPLRPVTADDVAYSINRILDPALKPYPSPVGPAFFAQIAGADKVLDGSAKTASGLKVIDPSTIEITIGAPNRAFLNVLAMSFGSIVPKELAGADTTKFSAAPVGTGAFYLESYTKGEKAVLKRNTQYWRAGYPRVDTVEYRLGVDANTQLQQVQADQLDIMGNDIPSGAYTAVSADPAYKDQFVRESLVATNFLVMDSSQPDGPLSNVKVRQAIAKAIDKDNLLLLNNGRGTKAGCIYPPQLTSFNAACDPYPRDVEGAKALLAEAGFKDGFSTTLYTDTQDLSKTMSESMIQDLADIGIKVELVQQDFDVLIGTITTPHAAPITYIGWFQDFPDPSDFYDPILSCAVNVPGGASYGWYCNEAADTLAAQARGEADAAKRTQMYQQLEEMVMADVPSAPLFNPDTAILVSKKVVGNPFHPAYFIDLDEVDASE